MTKSSAKNIIVFVCSCAFICLLFIALIRNASGYKHISFTTFLEFISNPPAIIPNVNISDFAITGSWGAFNFLKNFFNIFAQLIGIVVWFASSVLNLFAYAFYFIRYIFQI